MSAPDVICLGEALVDFLPQQPGHKVRDVETWTRCPGGAPSNVAIGLSRLGARSALLGVTGTDEFGHFLKGALALEGVDASHLRMTGDGKTGLAFVSLGENGERSFSFHRTRSAELFLVEVDGDLPFVLSARALHCGTNSLLWRPAQRAMVKMVQAGQAAGKLVSCDPNLRLHLWAEPQELRELLGFLLPSCGVVKLSEEEIGFVTGTGDVEQALVSLRKQGVLLPVVTRAAEGAVFFWQGKVVRVPSPPAVAIDSTGAGDGFMAALLFGLCRLYPDAAALKGAGIGELRELMTFACLAASRVVERLGAVAGLPRLAEIEGALPQLLRAAPKSDPQAS
ncbi:MAG: carbohydrate kinase family protein [Myxococcaceae bacterium]